MAKESTFYDEALQVRREFAQIAATYDVGKHNALRTEIDSLLIMYDQAIEKARQWDNLDEKVGDCYDSEDDFQLLNIGEAAAMAFGYLK